MLVALLMASAGSSAPAAEPPIKEPSVFAPWTFEQPEQTPEPEVQDRTIHGRIVLVSDDGSPVTERSEFANAVAYFEPLNNDDVELVEASAQLLTERRQFVPRVLLVQAGTEVRFPNADPILHNVFSTSSGNRFNLGHYGEGPGESHRFVQPGLVRVFCNVHPAMSAHIVVVNSAHFTHPDRNGQFRLEDVPPVAGRLTVWHERAEARQFDIDAEGGSVDIGDVELAMTVRQLRPQRERMRRRGRY